jgi:hypothetical protein
MVLDLQLLERALLLEERGSRIQELESVPCLHAYVCVCVCVFVCVYVCMCVYVCVCVLRM